MTDASPEVTSQTDLSSPESIEPRLDSNENLTPSQVHELDKMDRFKFRGQDWTPKDLERAILRQKDYTQKTQDLAKERQSLETERKFQTNLYADLNLVKNNPQLAREFVKVYPERYHSYLKEILSNQPQTETSPTQSQSPNQKFDYETENRLASLEKYYHDQEVSKNQTQIEASLERYSKDYPYAVKEMVIGRVFEAYNQMLAQDPGAQLTDKMWENAYKGVNTYMENLVNTQYKERINKQLEANQKSKAPSGAGGTVGRAPAKFKNLKEVTDYAVRDLTSRS